MDKAEEQAILLIKAHPDDPSFPFTLALIAERRNNQSRAMEIYANLNQSHPSFLGPYNNLAIHHAQEGGHEAAVAILNRALQSHPAVATIYKNPTTIYEQMASEAYRKALSAKMPLPPLKLVPMSEIKSRKSTSKGTDLLSELPVR